MYERNDLEGAALCGDLAIEFSAATGQADPAVFSLPRLARTLLARGDVTGAIAAAEKSDRAVRHPNVAASTRARHAAYRVMFCIQRNDLTAARSWGKQLSEYAAVIPFEKQHIPARLLIALGEKDAAAEQLEVCYQKAAQAGAHGLTVQIRVYQALAAATVDESVAFLAEALAMGQPEGYVRTFVDEGILLRPLLRKALSRGIAPDYTWKLLTIIDMEEKQKHRASSGRHVPDAGQVLLSEREAEILKLIAEGLSNPKIAERLMISLNTTKTHVRHILEKLNAQSRSEAIARAKELNLT